MKQDNFSLDISKIKTNVSGFDDLFFGGLRLPELKDDSGRDGICIVVYGRRGIGKTDLAMQIMRGVDDFLNKHLKDDKKLTPRFRTLNHRESQLKKKYISLEVANMFSTILAPESVESNNTCNICKYFPRLKEEVQKIIFENIPDEKDCNIEKMNNCSICKLIKHEVINYSDNSQSLHWTFGDVSDYKNFIDTLDYTAIPTSEIFDDYRDKNSEYSSVAYKLFKDYQKDIYSAVERKNSEREKNGNNTKTNDFEWSSYVIEGFTAFGTDELKRLPFTDLILNMKKTSAVSILVFDDRCKLLHLNADIIINMDYCNDEISQYMYYQLHIIKNDLQQHVHGWHKYRKLRDLSVKIYPSLHSHLTRRFSSDNAVIKLEQKNLKYPQSLLDYFQMQCANNIYDDKVDYVLILNEIFRNKNNRDDVYNKDNLPFRISLIEHNNYDDLMRKIAESSKDENNTISLFLLGKTEQYIRRKLSSYYLSQKQRENIHYWESGLGCIWSEEFASIVKEYINRWKKSSVGKNLHIIIDDFANINLFPLMEKERLLIPALVNICKNGVTHKGFDDHINDISITLSFVCTTENNTYRIIKQFVDNQ